MRSRLLLRSFVVLAFGWGAVLACAAAEGGAIAGIVEGTVVLIRQTTRYAVAEGVVFRAQDIVETEPGAFVQIEFEDGAIVGLAEGSRAILQPQLTRIKLENAPRLYLLGGWLKVTPAAKPDATFDFLTPRLEIATQAATMVTLSKDNEYAVFVESGNARLVERDGSKSSMSLRAGEFGARAAATDKPTVQPRVAPDFLARMPRLFRDRLPSRAAALAKRSVEAKPLEEVSYADVSHWLHTEPPIRLPLSRQWRSRVTDKRFRSEIVANLGAHMEWERVVFPERFIVKKKPPVASAPQPAVPDGALYPASPASAASGPVN